MVQRYMIDTEGRLATKAKTGPVVYLADDVDKALADYAALCEAVNAIEAEDIWQEWIGPDQWEAICKAKRLANK